MKSKLLTTFVITILLLGTIGNFMPQLGFSASAPSTVRFLAIVPDDSGTQFLSNIETSFAYMLQPLDVMNETDVTYNDLFSAPNTPRYNLIVWDRWLTLNNSVYPDLDVWVEWHYNNGSNLMWFYDGVQNLALRFNWQNDNADYQPITNGTWVNITDTPFTSAHTFQMIAMDEGDNLALDLTDAERKAVAQPLMYVTDTNRTVAYYVEETDGHGRAVWWSWAMHSNNPIIPEKWQNPNGIMGSQNTDLTYECVEPFIQSLYWVINAPAIKAIPTFAKRYDDYAYAQWQWKLDNYTLWWEYMRDKGIPFSSAQPTRHRAGFPTEFPYQPMSQVREWRDIYTNTTGFLSTMMEHVMEYYNEGWLEIMSHGWTHADGLGNNNETNEIGSVYYNASTDANHSILGWLNQSWYELSAGATVNGYSLPVDDINIYCVSGQSYFGNKTAFAMYELNAEYVHSASPHWSGWLFPNGTGEANNGKYVVDESDIGIWLICVTPTYDDPSVAEIERYTKKYWNSQNWFCFPSASYIHSSSWTQDEWVNLAPFMFIDTMEDTIESGNWTRVLWLEDVGDYDKGFKTIVGGHGSINWTESNLSWDGTTVSISDSVSVPYIIRVPHGRYVSSVTVNGASWYVFSDIEAYIPASATNVTITTSASMPTSPHIQTVRRASRNVTSTTYSGANLFTFETYGIKGLFAEVELYVGDKGNATQILGVSSWSYDNTTKILTMNVPYTSNTHAKQVSVFWYPASVYNVEVVVGILVTVATGSILAWYWRRKKKARTVNV